jgi:hypothetical protein
MKNTYIELLKSTSSTKIAFLKDVKSNILIDKRGKFNYYYIPFFHISGISSFLTNLDDNFYSIIPLLSIKGMNDDPHLILSKSLLLTHYSNPILVSNYLKNQLDIAINDFEISSLDKYHCLIF